MIKKTIKKASPLLFAMGALTSANSGAVTIEPGDYIPAPAGTNLFLTYFTHTESSSIHLDGVGKISEKTDQELNVGLLRAVRYGEIAGMPFNYQALLPFGSVSGQVGGQDLSTNGTQIGDPMLGFVIWPISDAEKGTYLGFASVTSLPFGSYDNNRPVSLGANTWSQNFQVVFTQKFGQGWMLDLAGDVFFYGDNDKYGPGKATLKQDNTYQVQAWISKQITPLTNVGLGYSNKKGGEQSVDGVENGLRTDSQLARFSVSQFVSQSIQLQAELYHGFETKGGYDQDLGLTVRFLKIF